MRSCAILPAKIGSFFRPGNLHKSPQNWLRERALRELAERKNSHRMVEEKELSERAEVMNRSTEEQADVKKFLGKVVFSYIPRPGAEEQIYDRISDITISMKALDYLELPECVYVDHEVEMNNQERRLYDQLKCDLIIPTDDGDIDAANAASLSNKLLQMSNGAVYDENKEARYIHSHKLEMLEDLIEAANGQPALIAYWFKHDRTRILQHLEKAGYGNVRDLKSSDDIADWNKGAIPIALIHPASAGHGLNIQSGGHILIWFGLTWSLELYQQTNARLWRQGQKETVTIHHIVNNNVGTQVSIKSNLAYKEEGDELLFSALSEREEDSY